MQKLFNSDISIDQFLAEYWQQKPLLIRQAFSDFDNPVSPDELAGLSCEADSNARLVLESCGERPWSVEYGPFEEDRFAALPETGWSLLVSDVERMVPAVKTLQQQFRFVPDWRFDDVMISYAPDGASVGAHLDKYDVFLLQAYGTRRWQISENYRAEFLPDTDLEILQQFDAEQDWTLQPGDMLYLPPNVAHHGIADGECMTCSIGFRTPASTQLASELIEQRCQYITAQHYHDGGLLRQQHNAEISSVSLRQIRHMIESITRFSDDALARWFGEYISENRSNTSIQADVTADLDSCTALHQHPDCRFLFTTYHGDALLFVNGDSFDCSLQFAEAICAHSQIELPMLDGELDDSDRAVLQRLVDRHYLVSYA